MNRCAVASTRACGTLRVVEPYPPPPAAVEALREQRGYDVGEHDEVIVDRDWRILCIARCDRAPQGSDRSDGVPDWDDAAEGWRITAWLPPGWLSKAERGIYTQLRSDGVCHDDALEAARLLV